MEDVRKVPWRRPDPSQPVRWHRAMGTPTCILEAILQRSWLIVPYIAVVVTAVLVLQLKGL